MPFPLPETVQMKALKIATFLYIPLQDLKSSNGLAVRFMCCKGLALCRKTTPAQNLPTDYVEKLMAYQCLINLHQNMITSLGQIGNADETLLFFSYSSHNYS
jgi:hypothetical protein